MKCGQKKREEIDRKSKELHTLSHAPYFKQLIQDDLWNMVRKREADRKSKELHTFSHAPCFKQLGQDDLSNGVRDEMEVERVAPVKQDALDEGDNIPRRIVARTHNGYVDHLWEHNKTHEADSFCSNKTKIERT